MATLSEPEAYNNGSHKRLKSWKPKKWRPEYERMVAYSSIGWSNKMIAEALGYSKEHVSTILNMEQAEEFRLVLLAKMREKQTTTIAEDLEYIANRTTKLLREKIDDKDLIEKSPFALIDRGMDVLKGLRHLQGGGNGAPSTQQQINVGTMVINTNQADSLAAALSKADEVRKLHAAPVEATLVPQEKAAVPQK